MNIGNILAGLNRRKAMGQVRHVLTALAGFAVGHGLVDGATAEILVGVGVYLVGAVWSAKAPEKQPK